MGPLPNLIYYASVCTSALDTIAEYLDGDAELPRMALNCLQLLPPYHSRLSHTTNRRMFACIIDQPFLYCTIADEALNRSSVMSFLEQVQQEFMLYATATGCLADHGKWEAHSLDVTFDSIFRRLVSPFVGIPQEEKDCIAAEPSNNQMYTDVEADVESGLGNTYYDRYNHASPCHDMSSGSRSTSIPLISKTSSTKYKHKKNKDEARDASEKVEDNKGRPFDKVHKLEITGDITGPKTQLQRLGSSRSFKGQQVAQRMWWRSVKIVLMLDAFICLILFCIWLGICRGFSCTKDDSNS
ncbi:hypothetical protein L7F22_054683 [Adiantum nelumboides]|nr:hypothetical protein [Adiantum nelumboides]